MTESTKIDYVSIVQDLRDEADLCRNETATDIADLLDDAASCIVAMKSQFTALRSDLAAANAENAVLRDAINDALPWMIKLGDYIGNGTQADPMGRCNAILKMRIAVEKRND